MYVAFTILIAVQFLVVATHDLVEIPGLTHSSQMRAVLGRRKLWLATAVNSIFPGAAVGFAVYFWNRPSPLFVHRYWLIYCGVTVASAIGMWYLPYFRGANEKLKDEYRRFYAGTRQVLPARGENPRPNLLHVIFHVLFVATLVLAVLLNTHRG
jgi:hypothetical protein